MTTQVYSIKFKDGIATEPATDEENMESIRRNMEAIVESVEPMRRQSNERKEARE